MKLEEALPILRRLYQPLFRGLDLRLVGDHICDQDHRVGECPHPDSAKYTELDAALDSRETLTSRLEQGGPLKPTQGWPPFFTHIRGTARIFRALIREWGESAGAR